MKACVKLMYDDAISDELFELECIADNSTSSKFFRKNWYSKLFTDSVEKHMVAMCYYGWLVAKGKSTLKYR